MEDGNNNNIVLNVRPSATEIQSARVVGGLSDDPHNSMQLDTSISESDRMHLAGLKSSSAAMLDETGLNDNLMPKPISMDQQQQQQHPMMMNPYAQQNNVMQNNGMYQGGYGGAPPHPMMNAYQNSMAFGGHPMMMGHSTHGGSQQMGMMAQNQQTGYPMMYGMPGAGVMMDLNQMAQQQQQMGQGGGSVAPCLSSYPSCPWFDPSKIHQIEVKELGSSFPRVSVYPPSSEEIALSSGSMDMDDQTLSSPSQSGIARSSAEPNEDQTAYMALRNSIVDAYRANYPQQLTIADCRKFVDGDLSVLLSLFTFLCAQCLINFGTQKQVLGTHPSEIPIKQIMREVSSPAAEAKRSLRAPVFDFKGFLTCTSCLRICLFSFYTLPNGPVALGPGSLSVWCTDCARDAMHSQMLVKVTQPTTFTIDTARWTDRQLMRLFDGVEIFGLDWLAVSKYISETPGMPVVSPQRCLAAFLFLFGETVPSAPTPLVAPTSLLDGSQNASASDKVASQSAEMVAVQSALSQMDNQAVEAAAAEAVYFAIKSFLQSN